ncbi:MAG TPA: hypothetical protein VN711_04460 [Candidatus Saccharimonadales bacterium]|nr:hypothetical protein [Candidatus Saccharimonadales bacterium]
MMYKNIPGIALGFLVFSAGLIVSASPAFAQTLSLGIYPPIIQVTTTPPSAMKQTITIVNEADTPTSVAISVLPFTQSGEKNGQVKYLLPSQTFGSDPHIFDKIQLLEGDQPVTALDLAPKQKKNLTLHIGLPKDEPPGDYYFSIVFSTTGGSTISQDGAVLTGAVATNVLLSIGPTDKTTGTLDEFSAPWFVENGPIPFKVLANNLSHHFIAPTGEILIKNMYGQLVGQVNLLPVNILEGTSRYIPSTSDSTLTTALWPEKVLLGPYKATLVISLSPSGPLFRRTIYFLALPWQYLLGFVIALFIMGIIIYRVRERLK